MPEGSILSRMLDTMSVETPSGEQIKLDSHVSRAEGALLQSIIREVKPVCSLEVGCRYGVSSHFICEALVEVGATEHHIVDNGQRLGAANVGYFNLLRAGYGSLLSFYTDQSQMILPRLVEKGLKIEFALIDGAHTFDHTLVDFFFIDRLLRKGGVVAFDDADWPGIRKVCDFVTTNRHYVVTKFVGDDVGASSMIAFRKSEDDILPATRSWTHFVDF